MCVWVDYIFLNSIQFQNTQEMTGDSFVKSILIDFLSYISQIWLTESQRLHKRPQFTVTDKQQSVIRLTLCTLSVSQFHF